MARLETQIQQIFLTHPQNQTEAQVLYDEALGSGTQLFLVAEIRKAKRKADLSDLKKICEVILSTFRKNKKLSAEAMFETSLSEINQQLTDVAHKGRSAWLSKFSAVITLKSQNQIFLSNTGTGVALLNRGSDFSHILRSEKQTSNPLKTFENFSIGKIKENDILVLTLNNIFNFISLDLFGRVLIRETQNAVDVFSKILSGSAEEQFSCFILTFTNKSNPLPASQEIFAPLPETETQITKNSKLHLRAISKAVQPMAKIAASLRLAYRQAGSSQMRFPKITLFKSWPYLSPARKFFLASFLIFVLIFSVNLVAYGFKLTGRKNREKINQQITKLSNTIHEAEAALIYKDDTQAFALLAAAYEQFKDLEKSSTKQAEEIKPILLELDARVNKVSKIENPELIAELRFAPQFVVKAGSGFLLSGKEANNVSFFDKEIKNIFLINNPSEEIRGVAHASGIGHVLATPDKIYLINEPQKQVEALKTVKNANLAGIKFVSPNRLYVLNKTSNQVLRLSFSGRLLSEPQTVLRNPPSLSQINDFGLDKDVYLLSANTITKAVNGLAQEFKLPAISQPLTSANKIIVGTNLYILEANSKRLLILGKNGFLLNQIVFPTLTSLTNFVVDEQQRIIYLIDANKFYKITY